MNIKQINKKRVPIVQIDSSLDQFNDVVLFPDKVSKANKMLKKAGLPDIKTKKSRRKLS